MDNYEKETLKIRRRKIIFFSAIIVFIVGIIIWAIVYNLNKPESEADKDYARQRAAQQQEANSEKQFQTTFNIVDMLPTAGNDYEITYGESPDKPGQYAVFINDYGTPNGKQHALDAITSAGYNPDDYEIIYQSNPPGEIGN